MSTATGGYSAGGYGGGAGQGGIGGDGKRPFEPHGRDHINAGACIHCGFDGGYRHNIVHRLGVPCPLGCGREYACRSALQHHVWSGHQNTTAYGVAITPQTGPAMGCPSCPCAWYVRDDQYMQNHVNYCGGN